MSVDGFIEYESLERPVPGRALSSHMPYSKSSFLRCLMDEGMVQWSPAGMRGSLPEMEVMGTT